MSELSLADAMRLGAMMKPQGFGSASMVATEARCALGAALDAAGIVTTNIDAYTQLFRAWPLVNAPAACPACEPYSMPLYAVVFHLNDKHRWSREEIASWLDTIDPPITAAEVHAAIQAEKVDA